MKPLRAVIFDFDGLVLDTESTWFAVWQAVFQAHGHAYAVEDFHQIVGAENLTNDPRRILEARLGRALDWKALDVHLSADERKRNALLAPLPGVVDMLDAAGAAGCRCAIASSSRHEWVDGHLQRLNLLARFDAIICRDEVARAKPHPDLYLEALRRLDVGPEEALALEDSHHGTQAAKQAGMRCVAIPGPMTRTQDFSAADLVLPSLVGVDPADLWSRVQPADQSPRARQ